MSGGGPSSEREPFRPVPTKVPSTSTGDGGGGGGGGSLDECAFTEITILSSPDPAVVAGLSVGDVLAVVMETQPVPRLVVMAGGHRIAGSVTSAKLLDMMECIRRGYNYAATVRDIAGGRVTVEIHPA